MPETLLKKRKSQEKERADKAEQREKKKQVRIDTFLSMLVVMIFSHLRLALSNAVVFVNHLSGLNGLLSNYSVLIQS